MKIKNLLVVTILSICLLSSMFVFSACDEEIDDYWTPTSTAWLDFKSNAVCSTYVNGDLIYSYNDVNIKGEFQNEYAMLTRVLEPTLQNAFNMLNYYGGTLAVRPEDPNKSKSYFDAFNSEMNNLQSSINNFEIKKQTFITKVKLNNYTSIVSLQLLKEYKREYFSLLKSVMALTDKFEELYKNCYLQEITSDITSVDQNSINLLLYRINAVFIRAEIIYLEEFNANNEPQNISAFVQKSQTALTSVGNENDTSISNYKKISNYLELLTTDYNNYSNALSSVSLAEYYNNSTEYYKNNPYAEIQINKINYFINQISMNI